MSHHRRLVTCTPVTNRWFDIMDIMVEKTTQTAAHMMSLCTGGIGTCTYVKAPLSLQHIRTCCLSVYHRVQVSTVMQQNCHRPHDSHTGDVTRAVIRRTGAMERKSAASVSCRTTSRINQAKQITEGAQVPSANNHS